MGGPARAAGAEARLTFMLLLWQFKISVVWWMVIYFGLQVVAAALTVTREGVPQVAYFGHFGGFLAGLALIWPLRQRIVQRSPCLRVLHTWKERPALKKAG